jgi:endonuclease/exonuclease/phosphatase family metal-dependent hydrolase
MKRIFLLLSTAFLCSYCQEPPSSVFSGSSEGEVCRVMFWNSENLFDCHKDSITQDDEFLPYGLRGWNSSRYNKKINNMYKVFIAAGAWSPPDLIGLCEVENKNVLFDLIRETPFSYYNYRFIHYDSPDRRGIDVALLYNPATVEVLSERPIPVQLTADTSSGTRDILYARVKIQAGDTLSVFVNHWPSKYGGAGITAVLRETTAKILERNILEILEKNPPEKIIVMGDFNDPPESSSLDILCKTPDIAGINGQPLLINLSEGYKGLVPGSYKYEGSWQMIDQVMVNESLTSGEGGVCVKTGSFRVFSPAFLLERDEKFGGMKPNRTYAGVVYHGGFSDHLPVILDLFATP